MDKDFERKVLNHVVKDASVAYSFEQQGIKPEFFRYPPARDMYKAAIWFSLNYQRPMTLSELELILAESSTIPAPSHKTILVLFAELMAEPAEATPSFMMDQMWAYHKKMLIQESLNKTTECLSNNDIPKALTTLTEGIASIERQFMKTVDHSGTIQDHTGRIALEYNDREANPDKYRGISVGFSIFDQLTNGLRPGTVTLIIGAYKSAKSVLALNIMHNVAKPDPSRNWPGKFVYYHVNEGGYTLAQDRFLSCATGLNYTDLHGTKLNPADKAVYHQFLSDPANMIFRSNVYIDPVAPLHSTATYIGNKVTELGRTRPVGLIVVDYLGLMQSTQRVDSGWEKMGIIALELKHLAQSLQVPMVVLAHVNREGIKNGSKDFDAEDMGLSIEPLKHVDNIVSWRLENYDGFKLKNKGHGNLAIVAARDAQLGSTLLDVDTNFMKIKDISVAPSSQPSIGSVQTVPLSVPIDPTQSVGGQNA